MAEVVQRLDRRQPDLRVARKVIVQLGGSVLLCANPEKIWEHGEGPWSPETGRRAVDTSLVAQLIVIKDGPALRCQCIGRGRDSGLCRNTVFD